MAEYANRDRFQNVAGRFSRRRGTSGVLPPSPGGDDILDRSHFRVSRSDLRSNARHAQKPLEGSPRWVGRRGRQKEKRNPLCLDETTDVVSRSDGHRPLWKRLENRSPLEGLRWDGGVRRVESLAPARPMWGRADSGGLSANSSGDALSLSSTSIVPSCWKRRHYCSGNELL